MKSSLRNMNARIKNTAGTNSNPAIININEAGEEYIVYVAAPGMQRKDISICITNKQLTISACKEQALHCQLLNSNKDLSHWSGSLTLPPDADPLLTAAEYRNGELQIHIPKGTAAGTGQPIDLIVY